MKRPSQLSIGERNVLLRRIVDVCSDPDYDALDREQFVVAALIENDLLVDCDSCEGYHCADQQCPEYSLAQELLDSYRNGNISEVRLRLAAEPDRLAVYTAMLELIFQHQDPISAMREAQLLGQRVS